MNFLKIKEKKDLIVEKIIINLNLFMSHRHETIQNY